MPALATLKVNSSGDEDGQSEVLVNPNRGAQPAGPAYCSNTIQPATQPLPCSVKTRVDATVSLAAIGVASSGISFLQWTGDQCTVSSSDGMRCSIYMDGDHSVTAVFGPVALG